MKRVLLVFALACLMAMGAFAQTPEFFTFNVGTQGVYVVDSGDVTVANPFGVQFQFDDNFSAGFSFASDRSLLNVSLSPMDDVTVSMYTGDVNSELGFGLGVGYDFLVKKSTIFSAMGVYLDWLANGTATADDYDIENGGVFCVGLKAKFGL